MVVVVARNMAEKEEVQGVGHRTVLLVMQKISYSRRQGRSPCIQCYKPWDMSREVLAALGRSGLEQELHTVVMVEGKVQKCKLEEEVVAVAVEGEAEEEVGVEVEEEGCE